MRSTSKSSRLDRQLVFRFILLIFVFATILMGRVWLQVKLITLKSEIAKLKNNTAKLSLQLKDLKVKIEQLKNPIFLEKKAKELGLHKAKVYYLLKTNAPLNNQSNR